MMLSRGSKGNMRKKRVNGALSKITIPQKTFWYEIAKSVNKRESQYLKTAKRLFELSKRKTIILTLPLRT